MVKRGVVIIDVRSPQEFTAGHIRGSRNVPLDELIKMISEVKTLNKPVITVCQSGVRSSTAAFLLRKNGVQAINGGCWTNVDELLSAVN